MWRCSSNPHNLELLKRPPSTSCTNHIPLTSKSNSVCKSPWRPLDQRLVGIPRWRMALHLPFRRLLVCSRPRRAPQKTWHRCPVALPDSEGPAGVPLPPPGKTPMLQPLVPRPKWALTKDKSSSAKQREEWSLKRFWGYWWTQPGELIRGSALHWLLYDSKSSHGFKSCKWMFNI